jgi:predicted kinase
MLMPQVHLIEGPVGAGKSTFAAQLGKIHAAPRLILDDWMTTLFRADRPESGIIEWYLERKERCIEQIWKLTEGLRAVGSNAILELGLINRESRMHFYNRADAAGVDLCVYLLDAPREVRRERVRARNRDRGPTFTVEVPDAFFELASDRWEPFDAAEIAERSVRVVTI